ncbi:Vacuolar membrane amino acid uptake transporter fnx2 [Lachnellula suecica]|uniref:Vacuolar membrane amino acid uptake transporter fnx2 n=1 Tax=Lachnellula suecica TaxID=602035 RepID=A0A8T9C755_9HELO|nr:Vacuolar membrane amino acid uptake transporter fnx2 [Lachnellula suecica]
MAPSEQSPLLGEYLEPAAEDADRARQDHTNNHAIDEVDELSNTQLISILFGPFLGIFLAAIDATLVATLSAPISTSFDNMPLLSWLASAFFIATTVSQPISGKLTDIYGRRNGFIVASITFALGNLLCALATQEWVLILGRVVAGFGGGGIAPITSFIMSDLVPLRKRGMWQGVGNIFYGVGSGIGGPFGGWVNDTLGWRWAFVLQIPITMVSVAFAASKIDLPPVKVSEHSKIKRVDVSGATLLLLSLVLMLLGLNSGGNLLPWTHPLVLVALCISPLLLVIFIFVEANYALEPIIPVKLLMRRTVMSVCLSNWFIPMARFGVLFYGPIYFQIQGYSPSEAGLRLIPESVAICITSISCGFIMRWTGRYYFLSMAAQTTFVLGLVLISTLQLGTPAWPPFIYLFLTGLGYSGMITTTSMAVIAAVDHQYQAVITSATYTFRSTGTVIGITIASAVFRNVLRSQLRACLGDDSDARSIISRLEHNLGAIHELGSAMKEEASQAYMSALRAVFLTLLGLAFFGVLAGSFMREHKLHSRLSRRPSD